MASWVPFSAQLGLILASKLAPSWLQVASNIDPTTKQKNDHILDRFKIDFCSILAPTWGVQGGSSSALLGVLLATWSHLGAKIAHLGPQTPPREDLGAILVDF